MRSFQINIVIKIKIHKKRCEHNTHTMRFDALTVSTRISTCRVTTHKEAAAEAIPATVTYLTAVQHTGSYGLESKPTKHRSSNKARSVRHDPAAHMGEVRRCEAGKHQGMKARAAAGGG